MQSTLPTTRSQTPRISAIIPTHNRREELLDCLHSLVPTGVEVIVVDNGSTDGTVESIQHQYPAVRLVLNSANAGASAAKNQGAQASQNDILWFLDSDTVIPDPEVPRKALEILDSDPSIGAIGGEIYSDPATGNTWRKKRLLPNGDTDTLQLADGYGKLQTADYLPSCNLFMRRNVFEQVGGFDPGFFFLVEDLDLCYRIRVKGLRCVVQDGTSVLHRITLRHRKGDLYLVQRNRIRFAVLNLPWPRVVFLPLLDLLYLCTPGKLRQLRQGQISAQKHLPPNMRKLSAGRWTFPVKLVVVGCAYLAALARGYLWNLLHLRKTLRLRKGVRNFL